MPDTPWDCHVGLPRNSQTPQKHHPQPFLGRFEGSPSYGSPRLVVSGNVFGLERKAVIISESVPFRRSGCPRPATGRGFASSHGDSYPPSSEHRLVTP